MFECSGVPSSVLANTLQFSHYDFSLQTRRSTSPPYEIWDFAHALWNFLPDLVLVVGLVVGAKTLYCITGYRILTKNIMNFAIQCIAIVICFWALKGRSQLTHMRIRYHFIANLYITQRHDSYCFQPNMIETIIGWTKTHSKTGFSVNDWEWKKKTSVQFSTVPKLTVFL